MKTTRRFWNLSILLCAISILVIPACAGVGDESAQQPWKRDAKNPVVKPNGTTIHAIGDSVIIHDKGMFRMWFGCVGKDPGYASIGYCESKDGTSWSAPKVVFKPNTKGSWDDQLVEVPAVLKDAGEPDPAKRYKMWYGGADKKHPNLHKLGLAYSADGISWKRLPAKQSPFKKAGLVMQAGNKKAGDNAVTVEATVVKIKGIYHLWYNSWGFNAVVVSYATSADGVSWTKYKGNPVLKPTPNSWDSLPLRGDPSSKGAVAQPTVVWDEKNSLFKMWYGSWDGSRFLTYSGIGYAVSKDGKTWKKTEKRVLLPNRKMPGEEIGLSSGPCVLLHEGVYHLWYPSADKRAMRVICHATMTVKDLEQPKE